MNSESYMTPGGVLSSLTNGLSGVALAMQRRREQDRQDERYAVMDQRTAAQDEMAQAANALREAHQIRSDEQADRQLQLQEQNAMETSANRRADNTRADTMAAQSLRESNDRLQTSTYQNAREFGVLPNPTVPPTPSQQMVGKGFGALMGGDAQSGFERFAGQADPALRRLAAEGAAERTEKYANPVHPQTHAERKELAEIAATGRQTLADGNNAARSGDLDVQQILAVLNQLNARYDLALKAAKQAIALEDGTYGDDATRLAKWRAQNPEPTQADAKAQVQANRSDTPAAPAVAPVSWEDKLVKGGAQFISPNKP